MKNNKTHIILSYVIILVLVGVIISNRNLIFHNNKIILKNMDESTQLADKEKTISDLNRTKTEFENYITTSKTNLAEAITDAGVDTEGTDSFETMANNIRNIPFSSGGQIHFGGVLGGNSTTDAVITINLPDKYGSIIAVSSTGTYGNIIFSSYNKADVNIARTRSNTSSATNEYEIGSSTSKFVFTEKTENTLKIKQYGTHQFMWLYVN